MRLILAMAKKAKRVRSAVEIEANREKQRARDEAKRLARLVSEKQLAKEQLRGVDCSPASPLTEKEKEKTTRGRRTKGLETRRKYTRIQLYPY